MPAHAEMLVDPAWLTARLDSTGLRILECTTHLHPQPVGPSRIVSGRPEFERDHIPGAQYVNMVDDMSDPQGRYPYTLPGAAQIEALLAALDIGHGDHVLLYARGGVMSATRVWFVLHTLGHRRVSILDGGYERWLAEGRPVWRRGERAGGDRDDAGAANIASSVAVVNSAAAASSSGEPGTRAPFRAGLDARRVADLAAVRAALDDPGARLVNALSREQFLGIGGAHYGRPGSIPGSVSVPARELVSPETGCFLDADALRARFTEAGVLDAPQAIVYCGGGVAATVGAFVLEMLGHPGWAVYDNSLLEWSTIPELPMQCGET